MEVQPNQGAGALHPAVNGRMVSRPRKPADEEVSFAASTAVNQALESVPDKRVEMIERAQKLVGDVTYPPRETIRKLSELLAMRMARD